MPRKRPLLANGEIYHIILRGTANQRTFLKKEDYLRYLRALYIFNDQKITSQSFSRAVGGNIPDNEPPRLSMPRSKLVEILTVCLMPNHIHLLVRQKIDKGISLFFQKMGGYSSYFNKKYERFGSLFQRPFKAVHIKNNTQLLIITTYIHCNPIDLVEPGWKEKGISNPQKVLNFLESYLWSSYSFYLGKENLYWLIDSNFLKKVLPKSEDFRKYVEMRILQKE